MTSLRVAIVCVSIALLAFGATAAAAAEPTASDVCYPVVNCTYQLARYIWCKYVWDTGNLLGLCGPSQ